MTDKLATNLLWEKPHPELELLLQQQLRSEEVVFGLLETRSNAPQRSAGALWIALSDQRVFALAAKGQERWILEAPQITSPLQAGRLGDTFEWPGAEPPLCFDGPILKRAEMKQLWELAALSSHDRILEVAKLLVRKQHQEPARVILRALLQAAEPAAQEELTSLKATLQARLLLIEGNLRELKLTEGLGELRTLITELREEGWELLHTQADAEQRELLWAFLTLELLQAHKHDDALRALEHAPAQRAWGSLRELVWSYCRCHALLMEAETASQAAPLMSRLVELATEKPELIGQLVELIRGSSTIASGPLRAQLLILLGELCLEYKRGSLAIPHLRAALLEEPLLLGVYPVLMRQLKEHHVTITGAAAILEAFRLLEPEHYAQLLAAGELPEHLLSVPPHSGEADHMHTPEDVMEEVPSARPALKPWQRDLFKHEEWSLVNNFQERLRATYSTNDTQKKLISQTIREHCVRVDPDRHPRLAERLAGVVQRLGYPETQPTRCYLSGQHRGALPFYDPDFVLLGDHHLEGGAAALSDGELDALLAGMIFLTKTKVILFSKEEVMDGTKDMIFTAGQMGLALVPYAGTALRLASNAQKIMSFAKKMDPSNARIILEKVRLARESADMAKETSLCGDKPLADSSFYALCSADRAALMATEDLRSVVGMLFKTSGALVSYGERFMEGGLPATFEELQLDLNSGLERFIESGEWTIFQVLSRLRELLRFSFKLDSMQA